MSEESLSTKIARATWDDQVYAPVDLSGVWKKLCSDFKMMGAAAFSDSVQHVLPDDLER